MSKPHLAAVIDRLQHDSGRFSYLVLDIGSAHSQQMLDHGMVVPCQMTREEAVELCGETRVAAFDRMVEKAKLGQPDFRLTRYLRSPQYSPADPQ